MGARDGRAARGGVPPRRAEAEPGPRPADAPRRDRQRPAPDIVVLWGFHSVREALRSTRRTPLRLLATDQAAARLAAETVARGIEPVIVASEALASRLPRDAVHQSL